MRFAYVDLETTGGVAVKDRIIEIAVVLREHNTEIQRWQTLLNPGTKIPPFIARYNRYYRCHGARFPAIC